MGNAQVDKLTGLPGRQSFEAKFREILQASDGAPVTLALIDADHFKRINDELGQDAGDAVLVAIASRLSALEGGQSLRYGGDEFIVFFPGLEREQAFLRLEKLRESVAAIESLPVAGKDLRLKLSISVGVAACPIDGSNEAELMRKADGALYRAKLGGRNKVMLSYEERMAPKTSHFTLTQLERLSELAKDQGVGEAVLLREALDDLLVKYLHGFHKEGQ
jgi:diguanylate cyclase (GGDEF)-like protein